MPTAPAPAARAESTVLASDSGWCPHARESERARARACQLERQACAAPALACAWLEVGLPTRSRGRLTLQVAASTSSRRVRNRFDLDAPCDRCVHRQRCSSVLAGELLTVRVRTPIARAWRLALCDTARSVRRACWPKPLQSFQSRTRCRRQKPETDARPLANTALQFALTDVNSGLISKQTRGRSDCQQPLCIRPLPL